jgi:hypothetical protein
MPAFRAAGRLALSVGAVTLLLLVPLGARAASVDGSISGAGALSMIVGGADTNGSALRYAMDGNFAPLVSLLPINASEKASVLSTITAEESGIAGALLFGNRDGTVEPEEVTTFETLLNDAGAALPTRTFTSTTLVALTLDGAGPATAKLDGISFSNAVGPDASSAPIGVTVTLDYQFPSSGTSHTLRLGTNITGLGIGLSLVAPTIDVNLTLPGGTAVTGSSGFSSLSVTPDTWGWSSPSIAGTYSPGTTMNVSLSYGPAFPTGDTLLVVVPLAIIAGAVVFVLWRRRHRRAVPPA